MTTDALPGGGLQSPDRANKYENRSSSEQQPRVKRHPLTHAFPLAVTTLATFLVVFTILMARLQSGVDPALGPLANHSLSTRASTGGAVVTRASGTSVSSPTHGSAPMRSTTAVMTRTSGTSGRGESDDA